MDLYSYQNSEGGSIKKMYQWLVPYANDDKKWEYGGKVSSNQAKRVLLRSSSSRYVTNNIEEYNLTHIDILTTRLF